MRSDALSAIDFATKRELELRVAGATAVPDLPDKLAAIRATVSTFSELGIPYALIGGVAVGVRTRLPRATLDVNFAIPTTVDVATLGGELAKRGFEVKGRHAHSLNLRHESGEPVQLAIDPAFDAMVERAELMQFEALALRVVTRDDLLAMKRRAAADPSRRRSKALRDQADIALLEGDVPDEDEGW